MYLAACCFTTLEPCNSISWHRRVTVLIRRHCRAKGHAVVASPITAVYIAPCSSGHCRAKGHCILSSGHCRAKDTLWWQAPPLQFTLHPAALSGCCFSSCYPDLQKGNYLIDNKTLPSVTSPDHFFIFLDFCWKLLLHYDDFFYFSFFFKLAESPEPFVVIGKNVLGTGREVGKAPAAPRKGHQLPVN